MKTRFTIAMAAFMLTIGAATAYARKLYTTFGMPASSATYKSPTYTWAANTNNLMPMFSFANGELADYETLCFTFANISSEASTIQTTTERAHGGRWAALTIRRAPRP